MPNIGIKIGTLQLKNPVMVASGTFGVEYAAITKIGRLGALVMKTITLKPRVGNRAPRIVETPAGMLNSIGLENKGIDDFLKKKLPEAVALKIPVIASISGDDEYEFKELVRTLSRSNKVSAIELNLSCPNIKHPEREGLIAQNPDATFEIVSAARHCTKIPLIAKLSPNVTDITIIARAAEKAGADAVLVANTYFGMAVDIKTRKPCLGNITGGLSGPAIKPATLRHVWETYNKVKIPVIGSGGIMGTDDAIEYIISGATAVQIGTANFVDPALAGQIADGVARYLTKYGIDSVSELIGSLNIQDGTRGNG